MVRPSGRRVFGLWFGLFVPVITLGALGLAFAHHWALGVATIIVYLMWIGETARTTCSRCWAYGTAGCGLPSLAAPLLVSRKSPRSVSLSRIRVHYAIDLAGAVFLNSLYLWLAPAFAPLVLLWTLGMWWLVGHPKRHHGLLYLLQQPQEKSQAGRISLPILAEPSQCNSHPKNVKG